MSACNAAPARMRPLSLLRPSRALPVDPMLEDVYREAVHDWLAERNDARDAWDLVGSAAPSANAQVPNGACAFDLTSERARRDPSLSALEALLDDA